MATDLRDAIVPSPVRLAPLIVVAALALLGVVYVALFAQALTVPVDGRFANARGGFAGGDFVLFYSAGRLAAEGDAAAAYDLARYHAAHREIMDVSVPRAPWIYPPTTLLGLRFLGALAPEVALWTWLALSVLAGAGAAAIVGGWRLAPLGALYPGIGQALVCGQNGAFSAILLALVVRFWTASPAVAGAALGLLSYKPQIMAITLCAALGLRAWRVATCAIAVAATLVALSLLVDGLAPWRALPGAFADLAAYLPSAPLVQARWVTAFGFALALGAPSSVAMAVQATVALAALAAVVVAWRRSDDPFVRSATLAAGTLLFTPYGYDYDLAILVVPTACLAARASSFAALPQKAVATFALLWLTPLISFPLALTLGGTPASLLLAAVLLLAWTAKCVNSEHRSHIP